MNVVQKTLKPVPFLPSWKCDSPPRIECLPIWSKPYAYFSLALDKFAFIFEKMNGPK